MELANLNVVLETADGAQQHHEAARVAIVWQGRELWLQPIGNQLFFGVEADAEGLEHVNLLLRPLATNLASLELEVEAGDLQAQSFEESE